MPERVDHDDLPRATLVPRRRARISVVWIIPILPALVAIAIAVQHALSQEPTIIIVFEAGAGVEAGKIIGALDQTPPTLPGDRRR
jgi:paraquat-inducible protein B